MKISIRKSVLQFALSLFVIFSTISWASQDILSGPKAHWVNDVSLPATTTLPTTQIKNGVYYLLADTQIKVEAKQTQYYRHYADYIVNQTGVENNSQINIDYDPSYQQLRLHSLQVIRGQQIINKRLSSRIKLLQREQALEKLIYRGEMTLNIILDDIRIGDIIEYSYTIQGMNPAYQNIFAYQRSLNWSVPLAKQSVRILWHKPVPLYYQLVNTEQKVIQTKTAQGTEYLLQQAQVEPVKFEENTPSWFKPRARVYFSELQSWADVARWSEPFYRDAMLADQQIKNLVGEIQAQHASLDAQISAALRFVQDEIRYLAIEFNQSSHVPTPAFETLSNRYGDCKDKTVLFLTLLEGLGLKGYPALVNTEDKLDHILPNVQAFDHVISYLEYKGKRYWLDPTRSFQHGKIDSIYQPDYGRALILLKDQQQLTPMQVTQAEHGVLVRDHFSLSNQGLVQFSSNTQNIGKDAETQRLRLAENSLEQLQQDYLSFFQSYYPKTSLQRPIEYTDDVEHNWLSSSEYYQIEDFWTLVPNKQRHEADFYANQVSYSLKLPDELNREQPLYLSYPHRVEQSIDIDFTDGDWNFDNENFVEDNPFFRFSQQVVFNKSKQQLHLIYRYQSKRDHIPPEHYQAYRSAVKNTHSHLSYGIFQNNSSAEIAEQAPEGLRKYLSVTTVLLVYGGLYILLILWWLIEPKATTDEAKALFFPASVLKLCLMWLFTFGLYGVYWFYQNFRYIKQQERSTAMPWARALFNLFWYYPLWQKLKTDNEQRFEQTHLPQRWLAIVLALAFLLVGLLYHHNELFIPSLLFSSLLVIPLANYILLVNIDNSAAIKRASKWRLRHYLLALLSSPLLLSQAGSSFGLLPSDTVVTGNWLLERDIKTMQRQGIVKPGDHIEYFYSDAALFVSDDGNGFTQRHVFSYWKDNAQQLNKDLALYEEIKEIKVDWAKAPGENSTVTIIRTDDSEFILYVSNLKHQDKLFVKALKTHWQAKR